MVRQSNGIVSRRGHGGPRGGGFGGRGMGGRGRGFGFGGRDGGGRIAMFSGRGGVQKPPSLMARSMPHPLDMRHDLHRPCGPPPPPRHMPMMNDFDRMGPPRMPHLGLGRGMGNLRIGPRGRGMRPPMRPPMRGGMLPIPRLREHGGLLPPPMQMPHPHPHPGPYPFRHRPPIPPEMMGPMHMRGRGMPPGRMMRGGPRGRGMMAVRGNFNNRRGGRPNRGRGAKTKSVSSPSGELNKPWVTEAMKNEILKKHKLHQKAKKARTKEDWEIFKEHRNKVTTMLREAKIEYIGAHPDQDVEKILAEATNPISDKDETNEDTADSEGNDTVDSEGNDTVPKVVEGEEPIVEREEPMEEEGAANEADPSQDPEVEMNQESLATEPEPDDK